MHASLEPPRVKKEEMNLSLMVILMHSVDWKYKIVFNSDRGESKGFQIDKHRINMVLH